MPRPDSLAFDPEFLISPKASHLLKKELPLIQRLLKALDTVFPEIPAETDRWNLTYEKILQLEYFSVKVNLEPESGLALQLNVFPARVSDTPDGCGLDFLNAPTSIGLTTATLSTRVWDKKQGFPYCTLNPR